MKKFLQISLKLNFTPNILGCIGLISVGELIVCDIPHLVA